jgi:hypothetical protein
MFDKYNFQVKKFRYIFWNTLQGMDTLLVIYNLLFTRCFFIQALQYLSVRYAVFQAVYNYWKSKVYSIFRTWYMFLVLIIWHVHLPFLDNIMNCLFLQDNMLYFFKTKFEIVLLSSIAICFFWYIWILFIVCTDSFFLYQRERWQKPILRRLQVSLGPCIVLSIFMFHTLLIDVQI